MSVLFVSRLLLPIAALAAILLAAGTPPAMAQSRGDSQGTLVDVDAVRQAPAARMVPVIGRLVSRQAGVVAARTHGAVAEFTTDIGERVETDDVIAVLVRDRLRAERTLRAAEIAEAEAALGTAEAQVAFVNQELQRLENLKRSAAFSQARYEDKKLELTKAESAVAEARAALDSARANLRLTEIELADTEIRAPYPGVVSQRHTEVGSYLKAGDPVVTLIDDTHLEIEADVPSVRLEGLVPETSVTFRLDGGAPLRARVRAVVPDENPLTRTRTVRFTPAFNGERNLARNQSVTIEIPAGDSRARITVHKDAVLIRGNQSVVFVVADGAAQRRIVTLGEAVGDRFEVLDGLTPGDIAVVRGNERLRPGESVVPRQGN